MAGFGGFGSTQQTTTGGFGFGGGAAPASKPIGIGTTQANTTTTSSSGASLLSGLLNSTTSSTPSTGFSLGATTTSAAGGLGLNFGTPAASTTTSAAATTGFGFGATPAASTTSTATTGFSLSTPATSASTGLTLGALGTTSASTGFAATGFSGLGGGGLGGGLGGTSAAATTSSTVSRGLGGVNPANTTTASNANKPTDPKASSKEAQVEQAVAQTVDDFQKYVKEQKDVREKIARISCKSLYKVQEEVSTLKQALSLVSNGLQRNASAISKLKLQAAQELKYAEISQRTKDTPPGLQYENTAPTEYFQHMVVAFEQQMVTYRQQIEQMETYLSSLHHNVMLTPHELSTLLNKLLSSFVSLAAQLQSIHEQVNAQKEHYLNYRKVFHGETTDVFEQQRGIDSKPRSMATSYIPAAIPVGPTPFHVQNSPAAMAMAAMTNKTGHRPPVAAPSGQAGSTLGFGVATGGGIFGSPAQNPTAPKPLAFGSTGASSFGSSTTTGFGQQPTATVRPLGASTDTQPALGASPAAATTPFQLQKPPAGNKRNKKS